MIVDGNVDPAELRVLDELPLMEELGIDHRLFREVLEELCNDMLHTAVVREAVELPPAVIDNMLAEISDSALRCKLLSAIAQIADADGHLADAEVLLIGRASAVWVVEAGMLVRPALAA
jgi:uncharacterized tellurite resistance protein B-like protein